MKLIKRLPYRAYQVALGTFILMVGLLATTEISASSCECYKEGQCPEPRIINDMPYTIDSSGEYILEESFKVYYGTGITVQAEDVTIKFCPGSYISLKDNATAIAVDKGCNVTIIGADIRAHEKRENVQAYAVSAFCAQNLTIKQMKTKGITTPIKTTDSSCVTICDSDFFTSNDCCARLLQFCQTENIWVKDSKFKVTQVCTDKEDACCNDECGCDCEDDGECNNTIAMQFANGSNNWHVSGSTFENFDTALYASSFDCATVENVRFIECREGLKTAKESLCRGLFMSNICAKHTNPLSWAVSLNGQTFDTIIENAQLVNSNLYLFNASNSTLDRIQIESSVVTENGTFAVQLGGARGPEVFDTESEEAKGCTNVCVKNLKCRMASLESNSVIYMAPVALFFCQNCSVIDASITCDGGSSRNYGIGILDSYTSQTEISHAIIQGPCLAGIHMADAFNTFQYSNTPIIDNCQVRDAFYGINLWRVYAGTITNSKCKHTQNGMFISEGSTNAIIDHCQLVENEYGVVYKSLSFDSFTAPTLTADPLLEEPINGIILYSVFAHNADNSHDETEANDLHREHTNHKFD